MKNQSAKSFAIVFVLVLGMACVQSASAQPDCSATYTNSFDFDNGFNPRVADVEPERMSSRFTMPD